VRERVGERVVVTGAGVVTPIGVGSRTFARALREGRPGIRRITAFDCDGFETRIAGEVDAASFDPSPFVRPAKLLKLMSRPAQFAVAAAAMAREEAALGRSDVDPERLAVSLGAGGMGVTDIDLLTVQMEAAIACSEQGAFGFPAFARTYRDAVNPLSLLRGLPNLAAAHVAIQNDARGPNNTIATACTAGTQAIGEGLRAIQRGDADVVLAGGTDAMINPVGMLGFSLLGTLSRRNETPAGASRPFDRERDGFVIGEGAGVLVLEREGFARARGATALAELAGYGASCDAYRITDERPDAAGAAAAIRRCLEDAEAGPADVSYVNAHGTGTTMNDRTESRAIRDVFGAHADGLPVSSTKSMTGHLLAGAGAVEAVASLIALRGGFLPPTINYETPDPECDLDYVPRAAREAAVATVLSNSFGFGGQNACLLMRRP
jgi:3-oxoacyl-[acyl-carrier-protein] synthase II